MLRWLVVVTCALGVVAPVVAHADDPAERSARRHYERGEKLFALKKFDEALEEYQKAFDANAIPDFLFNIGQCYRNLGDFEAAIFSYKKFLKLDPEAPNREKVQKLIDDLEAKIEAGDTEKFKLGKKKPRHVEPEDAPVETTDGSPVYKTWWFWTGVAVVGAAAGVGIYLYSRNSGPNADYMIDFPK
jgi:tetratricopeptide (TPR) repeat protein